MVKDCARAPATVSTDRSHAPAWERSRDAPASGLDDEAEFPTMVRRDEQRLPAALFHRQDDAGERQNAVPALERANDPRKSVVKKIKKIGFVQDSFTETMGPAVAVGGRKRCPVIMPLVVPKAAKA